jgi:hypothetical protein
MNKCFFVLVSALLLVPAVLGQKNPGSNLPSYVRGTWVIARYAGLGGAHAVEKPDMPGAEIGKKITFGDRFSHDKDFLWFDDDCPNFGYVREKSVLSGTEKGTLSFYGSKEALGNRIDSVIVTCNGRKHYQFEIARDRELAIYYDNWFFFLRKQK